MPRFKIIPAVAVSLFISFLASCVSTRTEEPETNEDATSPVVLSIQAPAETLTRAGNNFKLRYIARIYSGTSSQSWSLLQRKEIIDGDGAGNKIVFSVPAQNSYTLIVFADYIPSDYTAGSNKLYTDYFYNTAASFSATMRTTPGSDSSAVSPDFFNNENYDAFYGYQVIYKEEAEYKVDMTLNRTTAQVIFRDNSGNTGTAGIAINKLGARKRIDFGESPMTSNPGKEADTALGNFLIDGTAEVNDTDKDLFYFFTLADAVSGPQNVSVEFTANNGSVTGQASNVTSIPVRVNNRTIVSGSFLPSSAKEEEPGLTDPPSTSAGDIILSVTTDTDWNLEPLTP